MSLGGGKWSPVKTDEGALLGKLANLALQLLVCLVGVLNYVQSSGLISKDLLSNNHGCGSSEANNFFKHLQINEGRNLSKLELVYP